MKPSKLYVLYNGMLNCDYANLVCMPCLGNADEHEKKSVWADSPVSMFLIEHPDGLIMFDTGCHPDAMVGRWDEENRKRTPYTFTEDNLLLNQLKSLGYTPDDVKYVVLSHLHEDHAGGVEFFKNSKLIVSDVELAQTLKLYMLNGPMGGYIRKDIHQWMNMDLHWETIPEDEMEYELLEGVKILNFGPGHAFGMLGLQVDLSNDGTIILASDAINTSVNFGPPVQYPGLAYDTRGYEKTIRRIALLKSKYNAQVFYGHDEEQLESLRIWPEGYYS